MVKGLVGLLKPRIGLPVHVVAVANSILLSTSTTSTPMFCVGVHTISREPGPWNVHRHIDTHIYLFMIIYIYMYTQIRMMKYDDILQ